ncbi:hypothetical protein LOTGIDRAFT_231103 [Lottia gigantea]|uniref:EGF-like domain-containing protein n=1 Tax=Lottia gigantea TaxID=225164 RepID=V4A6F1_LOTGI|nr:hypothetical protein LOTGIDRAFT_231103 [Lottia gigantea]ESO99488.1 hypothetical protein LOTGIDRAFT_231103 [Lottia gigantea]
MRKIYTLVTKDCFLTAASGRSGAILDSISKFQSAAMICDRATREHSNYVIWKTPDRNIITSKTQTDRIKISGPYLIIHNLKESDRGLYKCALLSKLPYTMSTHDCRSHLCLNGGQCIEQSHIGVSNSLFVCICKSGYGGVYCAEEIGLRSAHIIGIVFLVITLGTAKVLILYFCCRFRKSVDFKILKEITKEDGTKKSVVERLKSALLCCKGPNDEVNVQKTNVKSKPPQKTKNVPKVMKETQTLPEAVLTMENNPSAKKGQSSTSRNTLFGVRSSLKDDINNLLDGVTGAIKKGSTNVRSSKPKVVKDTDNSLDNIIKGIKKHIPCTSKEKSPSAFRRNTLTVGGTTTGSIRNARDPSTAMNNVSIDSNSDTTSIHDTDSEYDIENKRSKHSFGETLYYPIPAVKAIPMTTDNKPDDNSKKTSEDLNNSLLDHARVILSSGTNISSQNEGPGIKTDNSNIQLNFSVSKEDAVGKKPEKLYSRKEDIKVSDKSTKSMGNAIRGLGEIEMCTTGDYELKSVPFKITSLSDRSAENKKVYQVTPHPKMLQSKPLAVDPKENNQSEIGKKAVADSDSERAQNAQVKTIEFSETVNDRARQTDSETPSAKFEASGSISDDPKKREISSRLEILSDEFKKIDDTVYCNTHKTSVFIEALNNIGHYIVSCEHGFMPMVIDDEMFSICCREHHLRISDLLDGYTAGYSKGQHEKSSNQSNLENSTIPSHTNDKMLQSPMEEVKSMHISGCDKERFISMDDFFIKSITITPSSSVGSVESNKSYQISSRSKPIQSPKLTEVELYRAPLSPSPTDGFNSVPMVLPQTEEAKSILTSEHDRGSFNSAPITSDFLLKSGIITPSTSVGSIKSEESYQTLSKSLLSPQRTDKVELCRAPLSPSQTGGFKSAPMVPPRTEEAKSILSSEHDKGKLNSVPINCDFLLKSFTITPSTSVGSIESEKSYQTSSLSQPLPSPQRRDNVEFYRAPLSPLKTDGFISGPMTPPRTEEAKGSLNSRSFESKTGDFLLKSITITPSASVCNVKSKKSHQTSTEILMSGDSAQPKIDLLASSHSDSIYSAASSLSRTGGAKNSTETKTNCQSGYERIDRSNNWDVCERKVGEQVDKEIEEDFQNLKKADPQLLSQFQTVSTPKKGDKISLIAQELSFGKQEIHDISNVSLKSMPNLDESQYFNPIENISEDSQNTTKSTDNGSNDMSLLSATEKGQSSVKDGTGRYGGKESVDLSDANYTFSPETTENCSSITNPGLSEKKPETSANLSKQISINSKTTIISSSDSKMNSSPQGLVAISRHSSLNELEDVCAVQGNGESCAKSDQLASHSNDTSANDLTERKAYSADNNSVDISLSTSITVSSNAPHSNPLFDPDDNSSVHTVGSVKRLSTLVSPNLKPVSPLNLDKSNNVTGEPNKQNISHLKIDKSSQIPPKVSNNIFPGNMSYKIFTDPLHESMLIESAPVTERCTKYSQYIKQNTDSTANEGIDEDTMPQERDLTETNQYFPNTITEPSLQNRDNDSMSRSTSFYSVDDTPMTLPYVTNTHDKNTQYSSEIRNSCVAEVSLETKTFAVTDADEVYDEYFNMSKFKRIMCPIPEEEDSLDGSVEFKSPYTSTTEFESVIDSESNILRPSASDYKSPWPSEYWLLKNRGEENDNVSDETWLYTESNNSCLCDGNERASSPVWSSFYQDDDKPNPAQF